MAKRKKTNEDLSEENIENTSDAADSFGLPDIDYKPIDRAENVSEETTPEPAAPESESQESNSEFEEQIKAEESYVYSSPPEEKSKAPIIIGVVIAAVVVIAGFLIYNFVYKPKAEKERQEQLAKIAREKDAERARLAKEAEEAERLRLEAEAVVNAKPAEGTIEILSTTTKRYYVVVTSAVDADLTMDYAKKLSLKGVSVKIIPPYGKWKFNRLAIGDYDTFALAQTNADAAKTEYGDGVWVIKY